MDRILTTIAIRFEHDVVLSRQRARQIAELLQFDARDQVRIATAVSEIARNAFRYAGGGKTEFFTTTDKPAVLRVRVTDSGKGIPNLNAVLNGEYVSRTGMGMGILGARRLMDDFQIRSGPQGTVVVMGKNLPKRAGTVASKDLERVASELAKKAPSDPFEELQRQNQELLSALDELQRRQAELAALNQELEDTNRGVVALYAELDERADYLRRASEIKTQFLSNMTHEFRTPLNSILSLSRILLDQVDGELNPEQQRQVKFIEKGADDLSEIVNDLLDLAKVEAGKVRIRAADFTVQDLFGALRGMLRPLLAPNSSVSLIFEDPTLELPNLHSDESKISQILRNLISNALKFTEKGEVRICARDEQDWIAITVADTGIGIALADQDRVFEEFSQVEGPAQKRVKGTGLGLPLSRKLAELLGGNLTLSSEVGVGSTFTLRVPIRYKGPKEVSFVPEISSELDPDRLPVLVVEDNRETLFIYEKYLKGSRFQPIPARTLEQAREKLQQVRPVAIILDIILSNESAWGFLSELKLDPARQDIPVIVITMVENEQKAKAFGAEAFHEKPIDRPWLLQKLAELAPAAAEREALVIDPDAASRYVLAALLSGTSFRIIEADAGIDGVNLARQRRPAVIFLDLMMPDMSGFQVIEELEADPGTREIPVVIHTARTLSGEERKRLSQRTAAILDKDHSDREASVKKLKQILNEIQPKHERQSHANISA